MHLFFDTETTGLPLRWAPSSDPGQPHIVQLAALLQSGPDAEAGSMNVIIRPDGYCAMPAKAFETHGISFERAMDEGISRAAALDQFNALMERAETLVAHNIDFDARLMRIAYQRAKMAPARENLPKFCTMAASLHIVNLPPTPKMQAAGFNKPKPPQLKECIAHFFGEELDGAHDALVDVRACARVFFHLQTIGA
ncbi:MAG: 3'-5' exonuclease [Alphaproteobacteria bacterium]